ncbi:unnamed protein product [Caenorhabditis nigoni]
MDSKLDDTSQKDPKRLILDEFRSGKRLARIGISFFKGTITLSFPGPFPSPILQIFYTEKSENLSEIGLTDHPKSLQRGNFRDLAIDDLSKILAVPGGRKLEILKITEEIDNVFAQKLSEKFENLSKIHVDTVYLHPSRIETVPVNNILNLCQSIKEIDISSDDLPDEEFKDKINGITALKNVETIKIHNSHKDNVFWDLSKLMMPRFTVEFDKISVYNFIRMMKALLESTHLKDCRVIAEVTRGVRFENGLEKCGARFYSENVFTFSGPITIHRCPIPNSDEFFEIRFTRKLGLPETNWIWRGPKIIYAFTDIERKSNSA